ncbi:MAG: phosphomannomutase/phosphoglucomutase [Candidatus Gastranaerophilales bacterium]|nr:phosphomannomutase/phosphoglucomutase [Candidatus Gastranaerophilales bacterium]
MEDNNINLTAFGKNDIRGIFPKNINREIFFYTAKGYVNFVLKELKRMNKEMQPRELLFTVCMDARLHSKELKNAIIQGVTSTGANILDLGLAPTPLGYYSEFAKIDSEITENKKVLGALIVTASHNPSEYNGLKMTFDKKSLSEAQIQEVKQITQEIYDGSTGYRQVITGFSKTYDIISNYQNKIYDMFGSIGKNIKIVVDSANATGGIVAPQLYRDLGCEVVELYSEPDGNFPNHHPNPSEIKTLDEIRKQVVKEHADFGIAFDGDSDRIGAIAPDGTVISGDKLLLIYADDLINTLKIHGEKPIIVSEVKCSQVLYDTIESLGGIAVMTKTGHGYIKSKMRETGALLAGEMSGHTFFKDRYYGYDDAIYAGCRLIEIVAKNKQKNPGFKLNELLEPFTKVYLSDEVRLSCPNEFKKDVLNALEEKINYELFNSKIKEIITIDGLRIIFEDGFALIRQSNTEPVFTLRFEAKTKEKCEHYKDTLVNLTNSLKEQYCAQKV